MQPDSELIKNVLEGQKEHFAVLVRRYEHPIRAIAIYILGDHHSIDDVVQEAFVASYRNLTALRNRNSFGPWLMQIARRCALDYANRKQKMAPLETISIPAAENPQSRLNEDNEALLAAVMELPDAERQVVMLRYFAGHSVNEVADSVGRSVGTVTKQLSRAHKRLRKILKEF